MPKTAMKKEKKKDYPVMGQKQFAERNKTPMPKQVTQSAKPAAQKSAKVVTHIKHGTGKPTGMPEKKKGCK